MTGSNELDHTQEGPVTVGIVRRRQELYSQYHDTAGTLITANVALAALYASLLFSLVNIGYLTEANFRNESWLLIGLLFWSATLSLCLVSRYVSRQRRAALVDILDAHDLRSSLPSLDEFSIRFNTTLIRANLIVGEILMITALIVITSSLLVAPPVILIIVSIVLFIYGILVAAYISVSNQIARGFLEILASRWPDRYKQNYKNTYRTKLTGPDIEFYINGLVLVILSVATAIAIRYLLL